VEYVDTRVLEIVKNITAAGKIPIIIGGGHNNAYPNIKGSSMGLKQCEKQKTKGINVINCDPHTDFRPLEGRHSGNGFSYAYEENLLKKYAVLGIHESYNTQRVIDKFGNDTENLFYNTYEDIFVRENKTFNHAMQECIDFCEGCYCGIELDLDAITNVPSSAKTSSGISPVQARQYIYNAAKKLNACYLHIAEGAPILSHIKADNKTGKLIAYLVADFIKGVNEKGLTQ
jgi:formiminoglutamase